MSGAGNNDDKDLGDLVKDVLSALSKKISVAFAFDTAWDVAKSELPSEKVKKEQESWDRLHEKATRQIEKTNLEQKRAERELEKLKGLEKLSKTLIGGEGSSVGNDDPGNLASENPGRENFGGDLSGNKDDDADNGKGDPSGGGEGVDDTGNGGEYPIALDLDNDGVELVDIDTSTAFYDINGDGYRTHLGWVSADDGFLAYDKDSDGIIVEGDELSFVSYVEGAQTDLEGLVYFDTNSDGELTSADTDWTKFGVWQDLDQDGETDAGEFKSLDDLSITSIDLTSDGIAEDVGSNHIFGRGEYTRNGVVEEFADVSLATSLIGYRTSEDGSLDIQTVSGSDIYMDGRFSDLSVDISELGYVGAYGFDGDDILIAGSNDEALLDGGDGNDRLTGGDGTDWLLGGEGVDSLDGGSGDDILFLDADDLGSGSVSGGAGFDIGILDAPNGVTTSVTVDLKASGLEMLVSGDGSDTLSAGFVTTDATEEQSIDTYLAGGSGNDVITGGDGNDWLIGGDGMDTLSGGAGNDVLFVDAADGTANMTGGAGEDILIVQDTVGLTLALDTAGIEQALGGDGDDVFSSSGSTNLILDGGAGNDTLSGGSGNDTLSGNIGDDQLTGGAGDDRYWFGYGYGADTIDESASDEATATDLVMLNYATGRFATEFDRSGDDLKLTLEDSDDSLTMEDWFVDADQRIDYFVYTGWEDSYAYVADDGANAYTALTDDHYHFITLAGDDTLTGAGGHDLLDGGAGNDVLDGGTGGSDTVTYAGSDAAVSVDLAADTASGGHAAGDSLDNIENLYGSDFADTLTGDAGANILTGADGADTLSGAAGDDTLIGGAGADSLDGGAGTDLASYLGSGFDTSTGVTIDLAAGTGTGGDAEGDTLTGIEDVTGSVFDDQLTGDGAVNVLRGEDGDDTLFSGVGDDTLIGGEGNDVAQFDGNSGSFDVVYDRENDSYTVTDLAPSSLGDEGADTVTEVETLSFNGDGVTLDLTVTPVAWAAMAGLPTGGSASWKLLASGGQLDSNGDTDLSFSVEAGAGGVSASPIDIATATTLGFDNSLGAVYETANGHVQVTDTGTGDADAGGYVYMADASYTGEDTFSFRVTDNATGLASVAAISVYAGVAMPAITEDDVISHDFYTGGTTDDTFMGGSGQDIMQGGEGNDTLDGGSGTDVAQYAGSRDDFDVVYDVAANTFTVTDLDATLDGNEGTDTVRQVGSIDFLGDSVTLELTDLVRGHDAAIRMEKNSAAEWSLSYDGGNPDANGDVARTFAVETSGSAVAATTASGLGFDTASGSVFETDNGHVQVKSDGTYEYRPDTDYEGLDTFEFRVTDDRDLASVATVTVGVGVEVGPVLHDIPNSVDLNDTDEYFSLAAGADGTSLTAGTFSAWVKRDASGGYDWIFGARTSAGKENMLSFDSNDKIEFRMEAAGGAYLLVTSATYTSTTDWIHVVGVYDSDNATSADRMRLYVDGTRVTSFSSEVQPAQGTAMEAWNKSGETMKIGTASGQTQYFGGKIAEAVYVDGQALDASSFGEDDGSGTWVAKDVSGLTYGDNGFHLDFGDSGALGADVSGNDNDFTLNNIDSTNQSTETPTSNYADRVSITDAGDSLEGGATADTLDGGAGDDQLIGGAGDDTLIGGDGTDTVTYTGDFTDYTVRYDAASGNFIVTDDEATIDGNDGTDTLTGIETIVFDGSSTTLTLDTPPAATDSAARLQVDGEVSGNLDVDGGTGSITYAMITTATAESDPASLGFSSGDTVYATDSGNGYVSVYSDGTYTYVPQSSTYTGTDSFDFRMTDGDGIVSEATVDIDVGGIADPSEGDDSFQGDDGTNDTIRGLGGDDHLDGAGGDDTLTGGMGDDTVIGGSGDDTLAGGAGVDVAEYAGSSADYDIFYNADDGTYSVVDNEATIDGNEGTDVLMAIEQVLFTGDSVTSNLEDPAEAAPGYIHVGQDGAATWKLNAEGGTSGLTFAIEGGGTAVDNTYATTTLGFGTANNDVFTTDNGHVQVLSDGTYEYRPDASYTGTDSFQFRVTNTNQVTTIATVSIDVGGSATPTENNDHIEGSTAADTIDGLAGDDKLTGGEGNDTLTGGDGSDEAHYAGSSTDFEILYNADTDTFTLTDNDTTAAGNEGVDTLSGIETLTFAGDDVTVDLTDPTAAIDAAAIVAENGVAQWDLSVSGGTGTINYAVEGAGSAIATTTASGLGFDTLDGDVFATTNGHVQVKSDGSYEYRPDTDYQGTDSFDVRATDNRNITTVATVNVGVDPSYVIGNAVELNDTDEYLSLSVGADGTSLTAATFSAWVKRGATGGYDYLLGALGGSNGNRENLLYFDNNDKIEFRMEAAGGAYVLTTSATYTSTDWMHIVAVYDSDNTTSADRMQLYVDGTRVTSFSSEVQPAQGTDMESWNNSGEVMKIGTGSSHQQYFGGKIADAVFIDGTALDASSFGEDDGSGNWIAKDVSGLTYGDNGFHLDFSDATALGADASGNGNDFSLNNITSANQSTDAPSPSAASQVAATAGNDYLEGSDAADVLDGLAGDDNFIAGNGDDTFTGGDGNDTLTLSGDSDEYDIRYDAATETFTIRDLDSTDGDDGTDTVTGIESFQFDDQAVTAATAETWTVATDSAALLPEDGSVSWKVMGSGGVGALTYSTETTASAVDNTYATATLGFGTANNDVFATANGHVQVNADGTYEYRPDANYTGTDTFQFRVTDTRNFSSVGTVTVGVGNTTVNSTSGHDSLEGGSENDLIGGDDGNDRLLGNDGDDQLLGGAGDDEIFGGIGDDVLSGGTGNDQLAGGAGNDTVKFDEDIDEYAVTYDSATDTFTVTDLVTSNGDEGTDTITGAESFEFADTTLTKAEAEAAPVATDANAVLAKNGVSEWQLSVDGGNGTLSYAVENGGSAIATTTASGLGFDTLDGDVFATTNGHVQVKSDGTFEYRPDTDYEGTDSFDFRVTDAKGLLTTASISLGVGAASPGYTVDNSLSLDDQARYLHRTPGSDGTSMTTGTVSVWVKRGSTGGYDWIGGGKNSGPEDHFEFTTGNKLQFLIEGSGGGQLTTTATYTNTTDWMHVVFVLDSDNATSSERMRLYVDGTRVTSFSTENQPSQGKEWAAWSQGGVEMDVGTTSSKTQFFDGNMAEFVFIDGQALDASSFGEDDGNGNWVAKDVSGLTYGSNGFYLDFENSSDLGADTAGSNDFTSSNLSSSNQSTDSPDGSPPVVSYTASTGDDSFEGTASADSISGGDGDDQITGQAGDDTLTGGAGADTITGGAGDDVYNFGRGDGADLVDNAGESTSSDKLSFGAGIETDQLWFSQSGNDLVVDIIGTNDSVTIDEWYTGTDNRVATMETDDGSTLAAADVANLVSAMAALTPPSYGETELSAALHTSLDTTIAANWDAPS